MSTIPVSSTPRAVQRQIVLPLHKAVEIAYKSIRMRLGRSLLVTSGIVLALAFLMSILVSDAMIMAMRDWAAGFQHSAEYQQLLVDREALAKSDSNTPKARDLSERLIAPQRLNELMKNAGVPTSPAQIASNKIQTRWMLGLALLVAFVGILNSMLMSVTERFREIGTMKCLGALDSFIIKLFLIESLFQGGVGTIFGVFLGTILSMASVTFTYGSFAWKKVPWISLLESAGLCLAVGVGLTVAGALYPAWQAARMQPIEAMRAET